MFGLVVVNDNDVRHVRSDRQPDQAVHNRAFDRERAIVPNAGKKMHNGSHRNDIRFGPFRNLFVRGGRDMDYDIAVDRDEDLSAEIMIFRGVDEIFFRLSDDERRKPERDAARDRNLQPVRIKIAQS